MTTLPPPPKLVHRSRRPRPAQIWKSVTHFVLLKRDVREDKTFTFTGVPITLSNFKIAPRDIAIWPGDVSSGDYSPTIQQRREPAEDDLYERHCPDVFLSNAADLSIFRPVSYSLYTDNSEG